MYLEKVLTFVHLSV